MANVGDGNGCGVGLPRRRYKHHSKPLSAAEIAAADFGASLAIRSLGRSVAEMARDIEVNTLRIKIENTKTEPFWFLIILAVFCLRFSTSKYV